MSRTQKTADYGSLRTGFTSTIAKCNAPDSFVTRLDIQTNQAAGWNEPYVSGFRVHCSDNSSPQALNWNRPANGTAYVSLDGKVATDGIKDLIVSHKSYINMVGYGTGTMMGNFKDVNLWQQAAQKEYNGCQLVGIECTFVAWLDGCRAHFSCPAGSKSLPADGATAGGAGAVEPAACTNGGGFSIGTFAGGIGAGLVVAAALFGLVTFMRRRQGAAAPPQPAANNNMQVQQPMVHQPQTMQQQVAFTSDPYDTLFVPSTNATLATSSSTLPTPMATGQYTEATHTANAMQQYGQGQAGPGSKEDWQYLPKP